MEIITKIFISHSSKDKELISSFVDDVLILSCGIQRDQILYTSQEDTGFDLGENIITGMLHEIQNASHVFFMISENFKSSEVCLNEMGAAWAFDKKCISLVLPGCGFDSIGWINSFKKAILIWDESSLDSFFDKFKQDNASVAVWTEKKKKFLEQCNSYLEKKDRENTIDYQKIVEQLVVQKVIHFSKTNPLEWSLVKREVNNLEIFESQLFIRQENCERCQVQLEFKLRAQKEVTIRSIQLMNKEGFLGDWCSDNTLFIHKLFYHPKYDINIIKTKDFDSIIESAYSTEKLIDVKDYSLRENEQETLSFIDIMTLGRYPDGYGDLPNKDWSLLIEYNIDEKTEIPVPFTLLK